MMVKKDFPPDKIFNSYHYERGDYENINSGSSDTPTQFLF
ncbi:hypothetical protein FORC066_0592 [Yersinia enterocolitica]|nr:hypothetical protein FORC066_0592 [Yersinia enterocolitica]